ncbi:MAG: hypothetical protein ACOY4O_16705 [Pseudomonadota bacterium]
MDFLDCVKRDREEVLKQETNKLLLAREMWDCVLAGVYRSPAVAKENVHISIEARGVGPTMTMIEEGGVHDQERGWITADNEIGPTKSTDDDNSADRVMYKLRDMWCALQQQARVVDRAQQALDLVNRERERHAALLVRMRDGSNPDRANDRQMADGAENANRVDGLSHGRKSRGA